MSDVERYRSLLPQRILVKVEKSDDGLWAQISNPEAGLTNCYTQAATASELIAMVNDAVQTHFEIPEKYRQEVGYYVPLSENHMRVEEMFRQLVGIEEKASLGISSETTLTRTEQLC